MNNNIWANLKNDLPASLVVSFVALPLCLGIALASNAPLFSGIIAGIVGGIIVGSLSGSAVGVSGPAAGLAAIVVSSLEKLGSWEAFLLAGVFAGLLQLIAGIFRGGIIAYYFPSSVIKGMLTGIGILIIFKQIPHLLGYDVEPLISTDWTGFPNVVDMANALNFINPGVVVISAISLVLMMIWEQILAKKHRMFMLVPAPLAVIVIGVGLSWSYETGLLPFALAKSELVQLPAISRPLELFYHFTFPDFSQLSNWMVYRIAIVIALVASIETLLCVEATDKMDPNKRITPTNRELKAQGLGNLVSCFIGGLPITQVIVRSSANIAFGAKTKLSAILHGVFLLLFVALVPELLNKIPLASLAAILVIIGYKLAKPALFKSLYRKGWEQFAPFLITILGIVFYDLLFGIVVGFSLAIFIILRHNYLHSHEILKVSTENTVKYHIHLAEEVSFLNKGSIIHELKNLKKGSIVTIDGSNSKVIDSDVKEVIQDFLENAKTKDIQVNLINISLNHNGMQIR
ncbi:SulP family inorganic anion transporter [Legionella yabuuchiae]|uniref:SulP family inorganic anion transporter n=1 Tax=Legionella yabuuchiae TaxID=376727 RepID=UPI0010560915|nr:SulP family inorganic anion transporter [Legionella yabuuchiae]